MNQWINESILLSPQAPHHDDSNHQSDRDNRAPDEQLTDALGSVRADVTPDGRGDRHPQSARPRNHVRNREAEYRDAVDADAQKILHPVGAMNVSQTNQ